MKRKPMFPIAILASIWATSSHADITVQFQEGAPKDRFIFENIGNCPITAASLIVDLSGSSAGLIFDVTASGAGVQVFQPFELVAGAGSLAGVPQVADGDTSLTLPVAAWAPGAAIAFTIDVDDTINQREITVSDAEITGAEVRLLSDGTAYTGVFTGDARALVRMPPCPTT
jgi:hypothetical protein